MRRQQVAKPRPLLETKPYLSVVALLLVWQAGQDLPIGASHEDGEGLLVSDAAQGFGGSIHCCCCVLIGVKFGWCFSESPLDVRGAEQSVGKEWRMARSTVVTPPTDNNDSARDGTFLCVAIPIGIRAIVMPTNA